MGSGRHEKVSSEERQPASTARRPRFFFLRDLLVNKPCQFLILAYTLVMMLVASSFFLTLALVSQTGSLSDIRAFGWFLAIGFAFFLVLFLGGFWLSNKIVGPIYRLEKHMRSVLDGEPITELRFRSGDQFQSTAQLYNQILRHFEKLGGSR